MQQWDSIAHADGLHLVVHHMLPEHVGCGSRLVQLPCAILITDTTHPKRMLTSPPMIVFVYAVRLLVRWSWLAQRPFKMNE